MKKQKLALLRQSFLKLEKLRFDIEEARVSKRIFLDNLEKDLLALYGKLEFLDKLIRND